MDQAESNTEGLIKALAVTAAVTQTELTLDVMRAMVKRLSKYPHEWVAGALERCQDEVKGRLSLADICQRLADNRPGFEEAWAKCPKDESETTTWTDEMAYAYGIAAPLLDDPIQARMAFKEAYATAVMEARAAGLRVHWTITPGTDRTPAAVNGPLLLAVKENRISAEYASRNLSYRGEHEPEPEVKALELKANPSLALPPPEKRAKHFHTLAGWLAEHKKARLAAKNPEPAS